MSDQGWNTPGNPPGDGGSGQGWGQQPPPPGQQPPGQQPPYGQQPGYGQGPGWGPQAQQQAVAEAKGFFGALFDFGFDHFVTPSIVKVVYVLGMIALVLGWLFFALGSFTQSAGLGVALLLFGWIPVLIYLAFLRLTMEFYYALVRMNEDVHRRSL